MLRLPEGLHEALCALPSFHDVRNELLLEELTLDVESVASTMALYDASSVVQPLVLHRGGGTPSRSRASTPLEAPSSRG
jgi:hypothetical protein